MRIMENALTNEEFKYLFESAGWSSPSLSQIDIALKNSLSVFSLYKDNKLVGMARLLGDKSMSYFIIFLKSFFLILSSVRED